ncbi:hypothetical protein B7R21_04970 [Subtercola boreus]|uniref:DUF222 domain-containing protein n=1 Tax=Subtercola boreus TaxID=120213 RepID=A0A3E0W057_9MICO|nr:hypothetical protein [Subtercola boreus]RFA15370.1 hypothetical protein B7R21_04970 [Subtercola boreus]
MTRGSLTIDRPVGAPAPVSVVPSKRQRFAAAVSAVVSQHRAIAAAYAVLTDLVEEARLAGTALHTTDSFTGGPQWSSDMVVERQLITELAVALHQSENDARRLLYTSEGLTGAFAATRAALESGAISYRHAEKIVQHSATLARSSVADYERALLPQFSGTSTQPRGDASTSIPPPTAWPT